MTHDCPVCAEIINWQHDGNACLLELKALLDNDEFALTKVEVSN